MLHFWLTRVYVAKLWWQRQRVRAYKKAMFGA